MDTMSIRRSTLQLPRHSRRKTHTQPRLLKQPIKYVFISLDFLQVYASITSFNWVTQAQAVVAAHQAQAAQITQAAYAAQAQAHAASQYGGYEAQNAYQNAQQWSNMAQASLINLHAAQQAANKATDIAGAAQASAEGHLGQYGGFVGHGYGSK